MLEQTNRHVPPSRGRIKSGILEMICLWFILDEVERGGLQKANLRKVIVEGTRISTIETARPRVLKLSFRRLADILVSLLGLVICMLLIPFLLLGNLVGNPGALLYRQERTGENGKSFQILKFRTMILNAEPNGAQWAVKNDRRATTFGKILRRTRLDEFPQFYNILKGDMSLIGPRPERPVFVKELSDRFEFYNSRHHIKPGLTGLAQVMLNYGSSNTDSFKKLQFDLYYIRYRSLLLDVKILFRTVMAVLFLKGH